MTDQSQGEDTPVAKLQPLGRSHWVWFIPGMALIFAGVLIVNYVVKRGTVITVTMNHGQGIKPSDVLRCRGITVGQIEHVVLTEDLTSVEVDVRLHPSARDVARAGSRFWVVRPQIGLTGIGGLETIVGAQYMAVRPGDGPRQTRFVALEQPPVVEAIDGDGLEVVLAGERRASLRAGSPVTYRQVHIGKILSVGLASDSTRVQARAYIEPQYTSLVRNNSMFWNVSGAELNLGIRGLRVEVQSLQALLDGGVAMATPDKAGNPVRTGHRFVLHGEPEDAWRKWQPALPVGGELLPAGVIPPILVRLVVAKTGSKWGKAKQKRGWALPIDDGLIAPADLIPDDADAIQVEVAGQRYSLNEQQVVNKGRIVWLAIRPDGKYPRQPRIRVMDQPEDCLVITDGSSPSIALSALRLAKDKEDWQVDRAVPFDADMRGAAVLSRRDGVLVGMLLVEKKQGRIVSLTELEQ